ncbi:MAG: hypothetical protein LWX70_13145 [Sphingobacteriia bacterium]|nr:hypothetical protein [Sphingobacteriia bacterium]
MKNKFLLVALLFISCFSFSQSYVTYNFGEKGQIKIPNDWTIFDGKSDKEIIKKAVIASNGRYQPTPGKYTIIRCNGYNGQKSFTLKLSYIVLEQSQTASELRAQKDDIIEILNGQMVDLKRQVIGSDIKIIKSFPIEYKEIGGGIGGKMSYIKQHNIKPKRKIVQYMLFKDNKMFLLTLGWDVVDEDIWSDKYNAIVNSLKF